jgi:hypothetical protein
MTNKTEVIVRDLPKSGTLETVNIYIKNAVVFYAAVHEAKKKYQSESKEFSAQVFVDEEAKDKLLDEVMVNKTFAEVGVTKTSKPPRKIKYMTSDQAEEGKVNYDVVKGLWGFNVAKPEFSKKNNPMTVNVINTEGEAFTDNIGNGSVVNLKLFGYRNVDNQVVITLDTVQVVEHIPFEGRTASDSVDDDILGSYKVKKVEAKPIEQEQEAPKAKPTPQPEPEDEDDSLPF